MYFWTKSAAMDLLNMSICTMSGMTAISRITIEMPKIWSNELRYFGQLGFLCWLSSRAYLWHYSKLYDEICWYIYIYFSNYGVQRQICKANLQDIFQQICKFHMKWCELQIGPLISTYFMILDEFSQPHTVRGRGNDC